MTRDMVAAVARAERLKREGRRSEFAFFAGPPIGLRSPAATMAPVQQTMVGPATLVAPPAMAQKIQNDAQAQNLLAQQVVEAHAAAVLQQKAEQDQAALVAQAQANAAAQAVEQAQRAQALQQSQSEAAQALVAARAAARPQTEVQKLVKMMDPAPSQSDVKVPGQVRADVVFAPPPRAPLAPINPGPADSGSSAVPADTAPADTQVTQQSADTGTPAAGGSGLLWLGLAGAAFLFLRR